MHVKPKVSYLSILVYNENLLCTKNLPLFFLYVEMAQSFRPLILVVPHGIALMHIIYSVHWGRLCWQGHVRVLLFQWLSSLFSCPGGLRKTWHCPAMSLSQSISHPLGVTRMLLPLGNPTETCPLKQQPAHTLALLSAMNLVHLLFSSIAFVLRYTVQYVGEWSMWILRKWKSIVLS